MLGWVTLVYDELGWDGFCCVSLGYVAKRWVTLVGLG